MVGRLVPQVDRSDDAAPTVFYALVREPVGTALPEIIGAESWLLENHALGVIVRPDGYALASADDKAGFIEEVVQCLPLIQALLLREL